LALHRERRSAPQGIEVNARHAAALALVGWYLMVPIQPAEQQLRMSDRPPLSKWFIFASYDSAERCEQERSKLAEDAIGRFGSEAMVQPRMVEQAHAAQKYAAVCIATDDPRLKEK
jgi:hypothetical protein